VKNKKAIIASSDVATDGLGSRVLTVHSNRCLCLYIGRV